MHCQKQMDPCSMQHLKLPENINGKPLELATDIQMIRWCQPRHDR